MANSRRERIEQLSPAQRALLARRLGVGTPAPAARPSPRPPLRAGEQVFDCSPHQRRSWLAAQIDPGGSPVATAVRLRGPLDADALAAAVDEVVARHDGLRTVAVPGDDEPRQRVIGALRLPLRRDETTGAPDGTSVEEMIRRWVDRVRGEPFALTSGPLVRAALLRLDGQEHVFLLAGHHFVLDAASLGIVLREVATSYATGTVPAGHPVQYPDIAVHQRRMLADGALHRSIDFWQQALDGLAAPADLPLPAAAPQPSHRSGEAVRVLSAPLVDRLTAAAGAATRLGLGPALLTAYQLLLARYTGRRDVAVGLFTGGRTEPGTEQVVGDFTNIVVVRNQWADAPAFAAAVRRVSESVAAALAHQDAPFESVVAAVAPPRVPGRPPLVQFGFNLQDYRLYDVGWSGLDATVLPVPAEHTNLDLTLIAVPLDSGAIKIVLEYPADRFAADAVEALATRLHDLLGRLMAAPDRPVWMAVTAVVPEPEALAPAGAPAPAPAPYVPPRTDGEELVAEVFAEVLEVSRVGVHDDFFSLGGHSLHAVRLVGRINHAAGLDVPIRTVFTHPTVAALTEVLEQLVGTDPDRSDADAVPAAGTPR